MRLGIWEIVLILVLAVLLFGGGKIAGVGPALAKAIRGFKKEMKAGEDESETDENKAE